MMDLIKTVEFITRLRKEQDMTQLALAAAMQVTHQAISKWETGRALPDVDTLLALSKLFRVSMESLLAGGEACGGNVPLWDENVPEDKRIYSETMAEVIKTQRNIPMLLEASEEMLDKDITDCVQTLRIEDAGIFLKLAQFISSASLAQIIKTFTNASLLMAVYHLMERNDIRDCVQTLHIANPEAVSMLLNGPT